MSKIKRNTLHLIKLLNDDEITIKPYSVSKLFTIRSVQRDINKISRKIEEIQKEGYEIDSSGEITGVLENISIEKEEEIEDKIADLQHQQLTISIDMCVPAVTGKSKNGLDVDVEFLMDNLDMSGVAEMSSFVTGGDSALAEFFRSLVAGGET